MEKRPLSKEELLQLTPQEVLERLRAGNERYVRGGILPHDAAAARERTATGQHPYAVVLGCIDSRVVPEMIFDAGLGELFVVRIAGNIVNRDILGSLEYACAVTGSKVVVVLGHTSCGAVKGAVDGVVLGNLSGALRPLQLAVEKTARLLPGDHTSADKVFVDSVARKNVHISVDDIRRQSQVLREMEQRGEIIIAGAMYDHLTGKVSWE